MYFVRPLTYIAVLAEPTYTAYSLVGDYLLSALPYHVCLRIVTVILKLHGP